MFVFGLIIVYFVKFLEYRTKCRLPLIKGVLLNRKVYRVGRRDINKDAIKI